jgi:hypothetical protein
MTKTHDASSHVSYIGPAESGPVTDSKQQGVGRVEWNRTVREQLDLMAAVQHNCKCTFNSMARCVSTCSGHTTLARDQRALDGFLWNRRLVERLLTEECISGA